MTILDEGVELSCKYIRMFNRGPVRPLIDYKQFSRELRKAYSTTNYLNFTPGILDAILEIIERASSQRRSAWVADFITQLGKLF